MSDRELLKDAAKAAEVEVLSPSRWPIGQQQFGLWTQIGKHKTAVGWWNPLIDDGDALRLAVKRRFHVCIFSATDGDIKTPGFVEIWQEMDTDPLHVEYVDDANYEAATRRAIVRAAAAIGAAK